MHPHRGFLLIKCLPCLIRVIVFMHALEVTLLTAAHKSLRVAFEPVPAEADLARLVLGDGVVLGGVGDALQHGGELADNFVGRGQHAVVTFFFALWVFHVVTVTLFTEPLDDGCVLGVIINLDDAVEWITAA